MVPPRQRPRVRWGPRPRGGGGGHEEEAIFDDGGRPDDDGSGFHDPAGGGGGDSDSDGDSHERDYSSPESGGGWALRRPHPSRPCSRR